jgi:hypothetical protein
MRRPSLALTAAAAALTLALAFTLAGQSVAAPPRVTTAAADTPSPQASPEVADEAIIEFTYLRPSAFVAMLVTPGVPVVPEKPDEKELSRVARALWLLPEGVEKLSPDDIAGTLTVRGTTAAVDAMRSLVRLLDVASPRVRLNVRVLQDGGDSTPGTAGSEVAAVTLETSNNAPVDTAAVGNGYAFQMRLTPHVNGDGSVTVSTQATRLKQEAERGVEMQTQSSHRRLRAGKPDVILMDAARRPFALEVTPTVLEPSRPLYTRPVSREHAPDRSDLPLIGRLLR